LSKSAENGFGAASRAVLGDGHARTLPQSDGYCRTGPVGMSVTDAPMGCDERGRGQKLGAHSGCDLSDSDMRQAWRPGCHPVLAEAIQTARGHCPVGCENPSARISEVWRL